MWYFCGMLGFTTLSPRLLGADAELNPWRYDSTGTRGLAGKLTWAIDAAVCNPDCGHVRAEIASALHVWSQHHPRIDFLDVTNDCGTAADSPFAYLGSVSDLPFPWISKCPQAEIWFELSTTDTSSLSTTEYHAKDVSNFRSTAGKVDSRVADEMVAGMVTLPYDTSAPQARLPMARMAQCVGRVLGLGHPNQARMGTGENYYNEVLANGRSLNASECLDPWQFAQPGVPTGSALDPDACTKADGTVYEGCLGVRPALMNDYGSDTDPRLLATPPCLTQDDYEGLHTLSPSCAMADPLPPLNCYGPPFLPPAPPFSPPTLPPPTPMSPSSAADSTDIVPLLVGTIGATICAVLILCVVMMRKRIASSVSIDCICCLDSLETSRSPGPTRATSAATGAPDSPRPPRPPPTTEPSSPRMEPPPGATPKAPPPATALPPPPPANRHQPKSAPQAQPLGNDFISRVLAVPLRTEGQMSHQEALQILLLTDHRAKWLLSQVHPDRHPNRRAEATKATARVNQAMDIRTRMTNAQLEA